MSIRVCVCRIVLLVALVEGLASADPVTERLEPIDLRIAFTRSCFLGINEDDAKAALKVFSARIGVKRGYRILAHVSIFDDPSELIDKIRSDELDLVLMGTWDYVAFAPYLNMPVEFLMAPRGVLLDPYVILTQTKSGIRGVCDLNGRHVMVLDNGTACNGRHWLYTKLLSLGQKEARHLLDHLEYRRKVSQTVLPVFFGQADACVVDRSGLAVLSEMNPQIGCRLRAIEESPPFLETICLVRRNGWEQPYQRDDLMAAMQELSSDATGQQILTLFKFDRFVPYYKESLDTIRSLRVQYDALTAGLSVENRQEGAR